MIHVEGLTKDYGSRRAIDNLNFDVNKGEILGFLGPNGAGKTTTMRILCGYMPPTMGKAEIAGFDLIEQSLEVRKRVGYMPETVPLYPEMTVFDYLKFMADLRRVPNAEDRVDELLEMLNLEDRSEGYIGNLSKGMRQRVGLAQALVHKPDVLILDEPTIGLDPAQIIDVRNLIRDLGQEHTILLSTHILSEAQQVCNRVMIINKGKIVDEGSPEQLQKRLTGAQRFVLHVGGDADGLESVLEKVNGVVKVTTVSPGQFEIETVPGQDPRPEVTRAVVNANYNMLEIRQVGMSLEDIFLELTREEPQPPETSDEGDGDQSLDEDESLDEDQLSDDDESDEADADDAEPED